MAARGESTSYGKQKTPDQIMLGVVQSLASIMPNISGHKKKDKIKRILDYMIQSLPEDIGE